MTITEADILRTVKQKLAEFEAARDQPAGHVREMDTPFTSAIRPAKVPARITESVDCLT